MYVHIMQLKVVIVGFCYLGYVSHIGGFCSGIWCCIIG